MIAEDDLVATLKQAFPDGDIAVMDEAGMADHYRVYVASAAFESRTLIERHQLVYQALSAMMSDGRLHAVEIKTDVLAPSTESPV